MKTNDAPPMPGGADVRILDIVYGFLDSIPPRGTT
jgi:hypothetical protein